MRAGLRAVLVAGLAACSGPTRPRDPPATIGNRAVGHVVIAVVAASADALAPDGTALRGATALAIRELHDGSGARLPVEVELLVIDAGSGDEEPVRAATATLARRTDVIAAVAALTPTGTRALAENLARGVPVVSTTSPVPAGVIELRPSVIEEARGAARFVVATLRARQPAVLLAIASTGSMMQREFEHGVAFAGGTAPVVDSYPIGANNNVEPLRGLAAAGVDAVFPIGPPRTLGFALRMASASGLRAAFVVPSPWRDDDDGRAAMDAASAPVYSLALYAPDDGDPRTEQFYRWYRQEVGSEPPPTAVLGHDAIALIGAALRTATDPGDPVAVRAAMSEVEAPGLGGTIRLSLDGRAIRRFAVVEHTRDGERFVGYAETD